MNIIKQICITFLTIGFTTYTNDFSLSSSSLLIDDIEAQIFNTQFPDDFSFIISNQSQPMFRATPAEIITVLQSIEAFDILQADLYLRTNPLKERSLLDEPIFEPNTCMFRQHWTVGWHTFYDQTNKMHLSPKGTTIQSYLAISQPFLLDRLQNSVNQLKMLFDVDTLNLDVNTIFSLFKNATVQERRAGFMFHAKRGWKRVSFRFFLPLYYKERNFSLTNSEIRAIEEEFGETTPAEQKRFRKQHLISDKFGFGDMRLELEGNVYKSRHFLLRLGAQATIPTAATFAKNFLGSSFDKPGCFPKFDFESLFAIAEGDITQEKQEQGFNFLRNLLLGAFDRLSANLLDSPLGNDGHLGLGMYIRNRTILSFFIDRPWAENFMWAGRIGLEYLFPATERRFFVTKSNPEDFASRDFNDLDNAESNLIFVEEELVTKLYSIAFDTMVQPMPIFRWTSRLCYEGTHWIGMLGSDFWLEGRDRLLTIRAPSCLLPRLDFNKARPLLAFQSKIFGAIAYKIIRQSHIWQLTLNASGTTMTRGIGSNFTASINIEANF